MKLDVLTRLDPNMAAALARSEQLSAELEPVATGDVAAMRAAYAHERSFWNAVPVELASVEDALLEVAGLSTPVRIYRPNQAPSGPALVYLHGGGFILGSLDTHDRIMRLLARESGIAVVGIDYALAPETKFPRQIGQIAGVLPQLERFGLRPQRLALGGDSAGAHLALAVTLELHRRGVPPPRALLLYYGSFGLRDSASRRLYGGPWDGLGEEELDFYRQCYLLDPEDARDPRYDLLSADLPEAPPAFIAAAALDPLLDDSRALATLLEALDTPVELRIYDGMLHGFLHLSRMVDAAMTAITDGAHFLRAQVNAQSA